MSKKQKSGKVIADMSGDKQKTGDFKKVDVEDWVISICDIYDADSKVCTAWTAIPGALG